MQAKAQQPATTPAMGNTPSSLPYKITKTHTKDEDDIKSNTKKLPMDSWQLHDGHSVSDPTTPVTILSSTTTEGSTSESGGNNPIVANFYSNSKKLVHPSLIRVIDTACDVTSVKSSYMSLSNASSQKTMYYIVTEPLERLTEENLKQMSRDDVINGLYNIIQGLSFLHANNLMMGALTVFVTKNGDWKLFDYSFLTPFVTPEGANFQTLDDNFCNNYRNYMHLFPPEIEASATTIRYDMGVGVHVVDAYNLGKFIDFVFRGRVPDKLKKAQGRLLVDKARSRPRLPGLLKCPVFVNDYIQLNSFLNDFFIKENEEKIDFINALTFQKIPPKCTKYKIMPIFEQLIMANLERDVILAIIPKLFEILAKIVTSTEEFVELKMDKIILKLFEVGDRAVRANLLSNLPSLLTSNYLKADEISSIFDSICSGFSDTHSKMREITLKANLDLLPLLSPPKVEKLMRYSIKLAGDEEASIRVNSAIFLGNICEFLNLFQISKFVIPALNKLMSDNFIPARLNALLTYNKISETFAEDRDTIASKIVPAISLKLVDVDAAVQHKAFGVLDVYLAILRRDIPPLEEMTSSLDITCNGGSEIVTSKTIKVDQDDSNDEDSTHGVALKLSLSMDDENFGDGWDDF